MYVDEDTDKANWMWLGCWEGVEEGGFTWTHMAWLGGNSHYEQPHEHAHVTKRDEFSVGLTHPSRMQAEPHPHSTNGQAGKAKRRGAFWESRLGNSTTVLATTQATMQKTVN